ncbi:hypothetical protein [Zobellella taiwanensis]
MAAMLLLALGMIYTGARMTLAGAYLHQTDLFLDDWAAKNSQPPAAAWQVAEQAAQSAIALYPTANGGYYDRLGRVYDWQQINEPIAGPAAKESRALAIAAYRQAIASRPQWPFSHINLATAKLRQGELDDEFKQAMERGFALAPWRALAYQQTAWLGLVSWHTLNKTQQKTVITAVEHGLSHSAQSKKQTEQLLTRLQRTDLL